MGPTAAQGGGGAHPVRSPPWVRPWGMTYSISDMMPQVALVCLVRAAVDRKATRRIQRVVFFSVNDIAHFESDIMPSKGGSILLDGGLVTFEAVSEGIMI